MAKPEWGIKRMCHACGAKFYDLGRTPPSCPKCGTVNEGKSPARNRRPTAPRPEAKVPEPKPVKAPPPATGDSDDDDVDDLDDIEDVEKDASLDDIADEESDELIEDASELGEDDDDMSEVMEHIEDEDHA